MKYIKLFESFKDIDSICKEFGIWNYSINPDGTVDVDGNFDIHDRYKKLNKLPLKFGKVSGDFYCHKNELISLEGSPIEVGGNFWCGHNKLVSLEGGPREVGGSFFCQRNEIYSLNGCPKSVGGSFGCSYNQLTTLEGVQKEVNGFFSCAYNQLTSLEGSPKVQGDFNCIGNKLISLEGAPTSVNGKFECYENPIWEVYKLFPDYKSYLDSLDYNYLRGSSIDKKRFKEALEEFHIEMPNKIEGYKWI